MTAARATPAVEWITVPVDSLQPHPRNYRTHPEDQLEHICRSIQVHGFYRNVVVARDHTILAGHGVVQAARRLGIAEVPVRRLDVDPNDPRAIQVLTGDNEMGNLAEVDDRELTELLRELAADDLDNLLGTGFDAAQLAALVLVTRPESEIADLGAAGEWLGLPGFEPGDPVISLTVKFDSTSDRDRFLETVLPGQHITKRAGEQWTCYWPSRGLNDRRSLRFDLPQETPGEVPAP